MGLTMFNHHIWTAGHQFCKRKLQFVSLCLSISLFFLDKVLKERNKHFGRPTCSWFVDLWFCLLCPISNIFPVKIGEILPVFLLIFPNFGPKYLDLHSDEASNTSMYCRLIYNDSVVPYRSYPILNPIVPHHIPMCLDSTVRIPSAIAYRQIEILVTCVRCTYFRVPSWGYWTLLCWHLLGYVLGKLYNISLTWNKAIWE